MANRGNSNLHDSSKNKRDEFATRHFDTRKKINADTFGYNAKGESQPIHPVTANPGICYNTSRSAQGRGQP